MAQWIDFKALKAQLNIINVLNHHGVQLKVRGAQASGFCPLPGHADGKSPSFSVNLERQCFNCFGCKKSGNQIDLEVLLQGLDPNDPQVVRQVALELAQRYHLNVGKPPPASIPQGRSMSETDRRAARHRAMRNPASGVATVEQPSTSDEADVALDPTEIVNPPLGFALQNLDPMHPYLAGRGFTAATIEHFGLGFCSKGMLKDRIAIPLTNMDGELVAYAGRTVDDTKISPQHPKYLFPGRREKGKQRVAFRKSLLLYGADRIDTPAESLVIVEGFASVWWLHQHGIRRAVALMGSSASQWQIQQIATMVGERGKLFVFPDGDEAGVKLARELLPQLAARRWTTWVKLLADEQPTDLDGEMLNSLLMP